MRKRFARETTIWMKRQMTSVRGNPHRNRTDAEKEKKWNCSGILLVSSDPNQKLTDGSTRGVWIFSGKEAVK